MIGQMRDCLIAASAAQKIGSSVQADNSCNSGQ